MTGVQTCALPIHGKHVVIGILSTWNIRNYRYVGDVSVAMGESRLGLSALVVSLTDEAGIFLT